MNLQYKQEFYQMYIGSPMYRLTKPNIVNLEDLLGVYSKSINDEKGFFTILHFSNWLVSSVRENHGLGLVYPSMQMLALVFVMEKVYKNHAKFYRDCVTGQLTGTWERDLQEEHEKYITVEDVEHIKNMELINDKRFL